MEASVTAIKVRLAGGAIRNSYLTLRGHLEFFPEDSIGGNTDAEAGELLTLEVDGLQESVKTDINGPKQRFRARGVWNRFFEEQGLDEGDVVEIQRLGSHHYRVAVAERDGGLGKQEGPPSRQAVLEALREFDSLGRERFLQKYGFGPAKAWLLNHDGKEYDSKAIYGAAFGFEHPERGPLASDDFTGGEASVVQKLRKLGFEVKRGRGTEAARIAAHVWVIRAGREGKYEQLALNRGVALIGWSELGEIGSADREQLKTLIRQVYGEERAQSLASQAGQIYRFVHDVETDDLAVLPLLSDPGHVAIGRISGQYQHREEDEFGPDARNTRQVEWLARRVAYERFDPDLREAFGQQGTVSEITKPDAARRLLASAQGSDASAIHLVLKWSPDLKSDTIELHRKVAEGERGAVWWGRVSKDSGVTGLAQEWLHRLREQLARGSETFVFLHGGPSTWRTRLLDVTLDEAEIDSDLVPDYYNPDTSHSLWVKVTDFEQIDPSELTRDYVLARSGDPVTQGGLSNQGPLIIRRLVSGAPSSYFILSQRAEGSDYDDLEGERYEWSDRSSGAWKQLANSQGARFVYYRPGDTSDGTGKSYFGAGTLGEITEHDGEVDRRFSATIISYREFESPVPFAGGPNRNAQTSIQPITRAQYDKLISQARSEAETGGEFDAESVREFATTRGLQLPDGIFQQVVAALESGKHIILTGPPGTAKTTLAQAVADAASQAGRCAGYTLTTATADWTTFETIGGLRPMQDGTLAFQEGHFLAAIEKNEWLVIDELNRSNFDRAFGQLFTVLSGQPVVLPYTRDRTAVGPLTLLPEGTESPIEDADILEIPRSWRIVATMNVFDKTLLFEMSFALMRRFAFIEVASPSEDVFDALIEQAASGDQKAATLTKQLLKLRELKDLGPAVYMDIARYLEARRAIDETGPDGQLIFDAFYSYLLPQFEGIDARQGEALFRKVGTLAGTQALRDRLRKTLNAVLGLDLQAPSTEEDEDLEAEGVEPD
jgi:MoxR-like ATPase